MTPDKVTIRGLPGLATPLGELNFSEMQVGGRVLKVPGWNFKLTPDLLMAIKQDAIQARSSEKPHIRELGEVLGNMVDILAKELSKDISCLATASTGFVTGFYLVWLQHSNHEAHTASGAKAHAAAKKKGRAAHPRSVRAVLEKYEPGWRIKKTGPLAQKLSESHFKDRDIENLRISVTKAKKSCL